MPCVMTPVSTAFAMLPMLANAVDGAQMVLMTMRNHSAGRKSIA